MNNQSNQQPKLAHLKCPDCGGELVAPPRSGMSYLDGKCVVCGNGFNTVALLVQDTLNPSTTVLPREREA